MLWPRLIRKKVPAQAATAQAGVGARKAAAAMQRFAAIARTLSQRMSRSRKASAVRM